MEIESRRSRNPGVGKGKKIGQKEILKNRSGPGDTVRESAKGENGEGETRKASGRIEGEYQISVLSKSHWGS